MAPETLNGNSAYNHLCSDPKRARYIQCITLYRSKLFGFPRFYWMKALKERIQLEWFVNAKHVFRLGRIELIWPKELAW